MAGAEQGWSEQLDKLERLLADDREKLA